MSHSSGDLRQGDQQDETHPDADWSGFVCQRTFKKHPIGISSAQKHQIVAEENGGFVPSSDAKTLDWNKPSRKSAHRHQSGCSDAQGSRSSSTFSLIGGPVPIHDSGSVGSSRWETETQAASRRKDTNLNQSTDTGRCMRARGVGAVTLENIVKDQNPKTTGKTLTGAGASLLTGLGKEVAQNFKSTRHVLPAPFATDGGLPTDPYRTSTGERRKDLLLENFSVAMPGYTGRRSFVGK